MKKLLITLMLISPFSFADWGDVYYCQMTSLSDVDADGKRTDYKLEKFQFKLDEAKKSMVFGNSGYFKDQKLKLDDYWSLYQPERRWKATWQNYTLKFIDGKFILSSVFYGSISSVTADCDKF
jgi:hypothetical protein